MDVSYNREKENLDINRTIYECSTCGKLFNWNNNSSWYGSDKDMEEHPEKIIYYCSDKCKNKKL